MQKKYFIVFSLLFFGMFLTTPCFAEVSTTAEQTGGDAIYVAGNPNLYPIEYYDEAAKEYKGILPEIYKQLSDETGIDLTYICGGVANEQEMLARNKQVEIVSAHITDSIGFLSDSVHLFSFNRDGEDISVSIGFSEIMPKETAKNIAAYMQNFSKDKALALSLSVAEHYENNSVELWAYCAILFLFIAATVLLIVIFKLRRKARNKESNELVDLLTGIGNEKYFRINYKHFINSSTYSLYYIVYISINLKKIETFFGSNAAENTSLFAANTLANNVSDSDFVSRFENGAFLLALSAASKEAVVVKVTDLVNKLNACEIIESNHTKTFFRAGVLQLTSPNAPLETIYINSKQGYLLAEKNNTSVEMVNSSDIRSLETKSRLQRTIVDAIENHEIKMYLQFVINPSTKQIVGAEALSRWHSKKEGLIMPSQYIEDMRYLGLIADLDFYIFEEVCKEFTEWRKENIGDFWVSCNFARTSLLAPDFCRKLEDVASKYDFPREQLVIEITEDSFVEKSEIIYKNISDCKKSGYRFALDDFGSGYSSFNDLYEYPVDMIKIDRKIISKSSTEKGSALLKGISRLLHSIDMAVLCEGVETEEEFSVAKSVGCEYVQGYYNSRVLPCEEAKIFFEKYSK